ncbi:MAG: hypothetical protein ABWZ66_13100 [Pyrinomonadaceae bacterium]
MKIVGKILAVVLIIVAIYTFDWHTWNQILVPLLLLNCAAILLTDENRKLNRFFTRISLVLSIFLILRMLSFC